MEVHEYHMDCDGYIGHHDGEKFYFFGAVKSVVG